MAATTTQLERVAAFQGRGGQPPGGSREAAEGGPEREGKGYALWQNEKGSRGVRVCVFVCVHTTLWLGKGKKKKTCIVPPTGGAIPV